MRKNHLIRVLNRTFLAAGLTMTLSLSLSSAALASNPYAKTWTASDGTYHPGGSNYQTWMEVYFRRDIELPNWGSGMNWYASAQSAGYRVVSASTVAVPPVDSVAVWADGHTAYVVAATTSSVTLAEGDILVDNIWQGRSERSWGYDRLRDVVGYICLVSDSVPRGTLDTVEVVGNMVQMTGWCFDGDAEDTPLEVRVMSNGRLVSTFYANSSRPDVDTAWQCGSNHGFEAIFNPGYTGSQHLEVYAINVGGSGYDEIIGSATVNMP